MRTLLASLVAAVALGGTACSDSTSTGTGKLTVQLTDAPFPFGEVSRVDVFVVRVDAKSESTDDAEAENTSRMTGWTTIATPNKSINLLDLQSGVTTNLGTATLTTGAYQGFRLIIDPSQSSVTLKNGTKPSIIWPSAAHAGIKIRLDQTVVVTQDSSVMILDFDVGRSFIMRGNSIAQNGLLFKPVIRAVANELTGSVSGTVRSDSPTGALMAGATVEVLKAGTPLTDATPENIVRSAVTDANGAFKVQVPVARDLRRSCDAARVDDVPAVAPCRRRDDHGGHGSLESGRRRDEMTVGRVVSRSATHRSLAGCFLSARVACAG